MKTKKMMKIISLVSLVIPSIIFSANQMEYTAESVIKKNIEMAGGSERIESVQNFSFKAGTNTYYVRKDGTMKVLIGLKPPVIVDTILIQKDLVQENFFHQISKIEGFEKSRLQCLATLISGLFSLCHFHSNFNYDGIKKFGPDEYHMISTKIQDLNVTFSLDSKTFLLRGMNLKTYSDSSGHYEFNYEFGEAKGLNGYKIPSSIFVVPVGSQTSITQSIQQLSEIQFNQDLDDQFFSTFEVNAGKVTVEKDFLKGNVLDIQLFSPRPSFVIVTNWRKEDIENAGFRKDEKLILSLDNLESELTLKIPEADTGQIDYAMPDARIMGMEPLRGALYYIYFNLENEKERELLLDKLSILLPIKVRRK